MTGLERRPAVPPLPIPPAIQDWVDGAIDLERCLLALLCGSPDEMTRAWGLGIKDIHFIEPIPCAAFTYIRDFWLESGQKMVPTAEVLAHAFPGPALALPAGVSVPTTWLVDELKRRHTRNRINEEIIAPALGMVYEDPEGTLRKIITSAHDIGTSTVSRATRVNMADTIEERRARYRKRKERPEGLGVTLGLKELDIHTGGLLAGELAVLGAGAKTGKTWGLLNAAKVAIQKGHTPIIFTLEVSIKDIEDRMDALFSGVGYRRLRKAKLTPAEERIWELAHEEIRDLGGVAVERPEYGERTPAHLCARARQIDSDYLIIDQLSHMETGYQTQTRKEKYAVILSSLHDEIGRSGAELPCLLAVQARRRGDAEMTIESFADAAEVEREADLLLGISRTRSEYENNQMRMQILGARACELGQWMLHWSLGERTSISVLRELEAQ